MSRFCATCGASHSGTAIFCGACGTRLQASLAAPEPSWQVVVGDQMPTMAPPQQPAAVAMAPTPAPSTAPSLRGPVLWTAIAAGTDLAAAYATASPEAMTTANYRAGLAVISLVAGLIAGRRRGVASVIVLLGTLGLSGFEGMTLWGVVQQVQASPQLLQGLLPNAIPQALTMFTSLRTAVSAMRKGA